MTARGSVLTTRTQALLLTVASAATSVPAHAADFTVTDAGDNGGVGQYRAQVTGANAAAGADRILFNVSPVLTSNLTISDSLTIGDTNATTISGNGAQLFNGAGSHSATLTQATALTHAGLFLAGPREFTSLAVTGGAWNLTINGTITPTPTVACPLFGGCSVTGIAVYDAAASGSVITLGPNAVINAAGLSSPFTGNGLYVLDPNASFGAGGANIVVNVNGATIRAGGIAATGIGMLEGGTLNMTGGLVQSDYFGLSFKGGSLNMTGGTVDAGPNGIGLQATLSGTYTIGVGATITGREGARFGGVTFVRASGLSVAADFVGSKRILTIGGTITGTGGTAITTGLNDTLRLQSTGIINGMVDATAGGFINPASRTTTLELGGAANGAFDVSEIGTAAKYRGFINYGKVESSTWTLTGTNNTAMPWMVDGGTLLVNGAIPNATTTVNAGATLGGTGTVGNTTVAAGGFLAPGNSIGTLTVQGNLTLAAAASYMVEVDPANADRTNVTGTANLGGATVNATFAPGSYVARQYTILNATGGLGGSTFGAQVNTNLPTNFTSNLSYDANNAYLNLALQLPSLNGLNGNQTNVGNALVNSFNAAGGIPLVFGALTPQGLTQVSGEGATGSQQTTFDAMGQFVNVLTDPFMGTRTGGASQGGGASSYADEDQALAYAGQRKRNPNDALAAIHTKAPIRATIMERLWSVWGAGYGGTRSTDGNAVVGSNDTRSRVYGAAAGVDYRLTPNTIVGFALGGAGTNFNVANALGTGRSEMFQAGLYGRHTMGAAYVSGALAYGWQDVTTDRNVFGNAYRANFNANALTARIEGGWRFATSATSGLTPYAAGQVTGFFLPNYAEQTIGGVNTFALSYNSKDVTASRSELGLRGDTSFAMQDAMLTLRGRAAWAHNFDTDRSINAIFQTLPASGFTVNGAMQARNAALLSAGGEIRWASGFSIAGTFEGEFSRNVDSYAGKGIVRYQW